LGTSGSAIDGTATTTVNADYKLAGGDNPVNPSCFIGGLNVSASITIPAGTPSPFSAVLDLAPMNDLLDESNESVIVDILKVLGATESGIQKQTVTITSEDLAPTVSFVEGSSSVVEGASKQINVALSAPSSHDIQVTLRTAPTSTAIAGTDYTLATTTVIKINAGDTSASVTLAAKTDKVDEAEETVGIDLSVGEFATLGAITQHVVTITDATDPPTIVLTVGNSTLAETGGTTTVTATFAADSPSDSSTFDVIVLLKKSGIAKNGGVDYSLVDTITIPAGSTSAFVSISAVHDLINEGDETVILDIDTIANGVEKGVQQQTIAITDNDLAPTVSLSVVPTTLVEGSSTATETSSIVTATLDAVSGLDVTVTLTKTGTATNGDYSLAGTILISAGSLSGSTTLAVVPDTLDEDDETVIITASCTTSACTLGTPSQQTLTIQNDDLPSTVTLSVSPASIAENSGTTSIVTATLSPASGRIITIILATGGTATVTSDYTLPLTITIPAGDTAGSVTLSAMGDTLNEDNETVTISVSSVTNGTDASATQTVTITNDDDPPKVTLSVSPATINENGTTTASIITVTLNAPSSFDVVVGLSVNATSTATSTSDYTLATTTLTIPAGSTTATTSLTAVNNDFYEVDETVVIDVDTVLKGTEDEVQQATVTIQDDEIPPSVKLSIIATELDEKFGTTSTMVVLELSALSNLDTTVTLTKSGMAKDSSDYTLATTTVVIPVGSLTGSVTLSANDDLLNEADETIIITIDTVTNGVRGSPFAQTATIKDDDPIPTVTLTATPASIPEDAGTSTITATLSAISGQIVTMNLTKGGTATEGVDYMLLGTLVIPEGSVSASISLSAKIDALNEDDETVTISVSSVTNGTDVSATQTVTITNDDPLPTVTLEVSPASIFENSGTTSTVTARLSTASSFDVTVTLTKSGTTSADDFNLNGTTIIIPAGSVAGFVTITAVGDLFNEDDETVILDINAVTKAITGTPSQVNLTINNDDLPPTVKLLVSPDTINENGGTTTSIITAELIAPSSFDVVVELSVNAMSTASATDYIIGTTTLTIPAGFTLATTTLIAVNNALFELDETVIIEIATSTKSTKGTPSQQTVTIKDDEAMPSVVLSVGAIELDENTGVTTTSVTLTLSAISGLDTTVTLTKGGTATDVSDYTLATTTVIIPAGSQTASSTVSAIGDLLNEDDETVIVTIGTVSNGLKGSPSEVTVTIKNDDAIPTITLSVAPASMLESAVTPAMITATLSAPSGKIVTVMLGKSGTATEGFDYALANKIEIPEAMQSASISLSSIADLLNETDETVIISVTSVANAIDASATQTVTITNDDVKPTVNLSIENTTLVEGTATGTTTKVTATLSAISGLDVKVTFAKTGTATETTDYNLNATSTILIPAGTSAGFAILTTVPDALNELDETVIIDIMAVENGLQGTSVQVTATITNDDAKPTVALSVGSTLINEDFGTTSVTATLSAVSGLDVTVILKKSGTANDAVDYTLSSTMIIIPAGASSASSTLSVLPDTLNEIDETVVLDIDTVTNGVEGSLPVGEKQTVTIFSEDGQPTVTLSVGNASINEDTTAPTATAIIATLSGISGLDVTVTLTKSGTAIEGTDYTMATSTIVIPAGSPSASITISAKADVIDELDETVIIEINTVTNGVEADLPAGQQKTVMILDNEAPPTVSLSVGKASIGEVSGTTTVRATLSSVSGLAVTVTLSKSAVSTATESADYTLNNTIIIPALTAFAEITISALNDLLFENDETVVIDIASVLNGSAGTTSQTVVTIVSEDLAPTVTLTAQFVTLNENPAAQGVTATNITATLSAVSALPVTVNLVKTGMAKETGSFKDYTLGSVISISAGSLSASMTLSSVGDVLDEFDETVIVNIDTVVNGAKGTSTEVTITITDDDATPTVTLLVSNTVMNEDIGTTSVNVTAKLSAVGGSGKDVTVTLTLTGTATKDSDYSSSETILIPAESGQTAFVTFSATGDGFNEADETIIIDITGVLNTTESGLQQRTVTIPNDDAVPTVTLSVSEASIGEDDGTTISDVIVTLSAPSGRDVTVNLVTSGTAKANDFTLSSSIVISAGAPLASTVLRATSDTRDEFDDTVIIDISTVTFATEVGAEQKTVTIVDDDAVPTAVLSVSKSIVSETNGTTSIVTATLKDPSGNNVASGKDVTVTLSKNVSSTATDGVDYTLNATTITILADNLAGSGSVTLSVVGDTLDETDETVVIDIDTVQNTEKGDPSQQTVTITDDDQEPTVILSVGSASINEVTGTTATVVTATSSAISSFPVTVTLALSGTAITTTDYTLNTTIVIPAGATSTSTILSAKGDALDEDPETVIIDISAVTKGVEAGLPEGQKKTVTIQDDNNAPVATLSISEGFVPEASGTTTVTVTLSEPSSKEISITLLKNGSATFDVDYTLNNPIVISAGSLSGSILLTALQDEIKELAQETADISIDVCGNCTIGGTSTIIMVEDDEPIPTVALSVGSNSINETGGSTSVTGTLTLSGKSSFDVTVTLARSGTATSGIDYTMNDTIVIPALSASASITLTAVGDILNENDETVVIAISTVVNALEDGQQERTVTILDDDPLPTVTLTTGVSSILEDSGTTTVIATLNTKSGRTVTVTLTKTGIAKETTDYTLPTTITIPEGALSAFVTLTSVGDLLNEVNETVIIDILTVTNGTKAGISKTVTITDNDPVPTVTLAVGAASFIEGNPTPALGTTIFTATLSAPSGKDVTIPLLKSGTATDVVDYTLATTTITILADTVSGAGSVTLTAVGDTLNEISEIVTITIGTPTNTTKGTTTVQTVTVLDDDDEPSVQLSVGSETILEAGGTTTVTATLSDFSSKTVTVTLGKSGTAITSDYTLAGSITVPIGSLFASITLSTVNDLLNEEPETVLIDITGVTNGTAAGVQQTVTITDNDLPPTVTLVAGNLGIPETGGTTFITAKLSAVSGLPVTVTLEKNAVSTATDEVDYTLSSTEIVIPAGSTQASATLSANVDLLNELEQTVVINIADIVVNGTKGTPSEVTVVINDDDDLPTVTLSAGSPTINEENAGTATNVIVTLSAVSEKEVTVTLKKSGVAKDAVDYTLGDTTVIIPAGVGTSTVLLSSLADALNEADETIIIDIDTVANAVEAIAQQQTVKIVNNDPLPTMTLAVDLISIGENVGTTKSNLTVTMNPVSGRDVIVTLGKTGTAQDISDYTLNNTITIAEGALSASATLSAVGETIEELDETVIIDITSIDFASEVGQQQKTVTITNDDLPPVVRLTTGSATINEKAPGNTTTVIATLFDATGTTTTSSFDIAVSVTTSGAAVESSDYTISSKTISIPAGSVFSFVTLTAINDTVYEYNNPIVVDISAVTKATEDGAQTATVTILNDEPIPTVSILALVDNIDETNGSTLISATLSEPSSLPVTVNLAKTGTAIDGVDYTLEAIIIVPAGDIEASIPLASVPDFLHEGVTPETVVITIDSLVDGVKNVGQTQTVVNINDDDSIPTVTLSVGNQNIDEFVPTNTTDVRATLNNQAGVDVIVTLTKNCNTSCGSAVEGIDFTLADKIIIPAGEFSAAVVLTAIPEETDENPETVVISIGGVENGTDVSSPRTVTIDDDDSPPLVTLSAELVTISETSGTTTTKITATLKDASSFDVTVTLGINATSTATSGPDYDLSATTLFFPPGTKAVSVTLTAKGDAPLDEVDETVVIDILGTTPTAVEDGVQQVTITILDKDAAPTATLTANGASLDEANPGTSILVTANISVVSAKDITLTLNKTGLAENVKDYNIVDKIVIPAGSLTKSVGLTVVDDLLNELPETIILAATCDTTCALGSPSSHTVTIADDEDEPTVTLTTELTGVNESGTAAPTATAVTVALNTLSGKNVTVNLKTSGVAFLTNGVAPNIQDYTLNTTVVIPAGNISTTVTLSAIADTQDEADETVIIDIETVTNGTEDGIQQKTVTIVDKNVPSLVTLSVEKTPIFEKPTLGNKTKITATLDILSGFDVVVNLETTGTAENLVDYNLPGFIKIPAGRFSAFVDMITINDTLNEADEETAIIDISTVENGTEDAIQQQTVAIVSDDLLPTVSLNVGSFTINEDTGATTTQVIVSLSAISQKNVTVTFTKTGFATEGADYTLVGTATILAGTSVASVTLSAISDTLNETDEEVVIDIDTVENGTENGNQQKIVKIINNDVIPTVTLLADTNTLAEDGTGTKSTSITVKLSAPSGQEVTVTLAKSGTATDITDYTLASTTVVIPKGITEMAVTLSSVADLLNEIDETVILDIDTVTNVLETVAQQQTITITNNDLQPTVTLATATSTILESLPSNSTQVTVTLSAPSGRDVKVTLVLSGDAKDEIDYKFDTKSLTILAGATTGTFTLTALDDPMDEVNEPVIIEIDTVENGLEIGIQKKTVTIADDDDLPTVTLSINKLTINEKGLGNSASVLATLSTVSSKDVTVTLTKTGTAKETLDYTVDGTILIPAGAPFASITLTSVEDAIDELDETVILDINLVTNGTESGVQQASTTILDGESAPTVT
jgi:hypothetical protein